MPNVGRSQREAQRAQQVYVNETNRLLAQMGQQATALAAADAQQIAASAALRATGGMAEVIGKFAVAMSREINNKDMRKVYEEAARAGQIVMMRRYKATRKTTGLRYRGEDTGKFKRYTGVMESLLEQGDAFFKIREDGVDFVMPAMLDRAAPQWRRLNFGASPAATPPANNVPITFFGTKVPGPSLSGIRPSKAFRIPPGIWSRQLLAQSKMLSVGGKDTGRIEGASTLPGWKPDPKKGKMIDPGGPGPAFYPTSQIKGAGFGENESRMTRGIVGGRFFDAGIAEFNRKLGWGMEVMVEKWVQEAAGPGKSEGPMRLNKTDAQRHVGELNSYFSKHASDDRRKFQARLRSTLR